MGRVRVCPVEELPEGAVRVVQSGRRYIAVFHRQGELFALDDTCPHMGGSLGSGWTTEQGTVVCPWHGWEFRICDGTGVWPPGVDVATFPVVVEEGVVYVVLDGEGDASSAPS